MELIEKFDMKVPFSLDAWQYEALEHEGNLCINSGRQVGKSEVISIKAARRMAARRTSILVISVTEDQAEIILSKTLAHLEANFPRLICKGRKKPTKHTVHLTNGSMVRTKAIGQTGLGVRGFTVDVLVGDEAAYIPDNVWVAATPMLLTTGGEQWLLSTPNAMEGYFYEAYTNPAMGFKTIHVNSEEVAKARPEPLRGIMLNHLMREKARMTDLQYAQQYLAQFLEELSQFFPDSLIRSCQVLDRVILPLPRRGLGDFYLGVDVARMGGDESTFEVLEKRQGLWYHRENIALKYVTTLQTTSKVIELEQIWEFKRIYIDDGGLGVAVFDQLLHEESTRRKVEAINNAKRSLDREETRKKKLLKEDLYMNLRRMMERGEIKLLKDPEVFASLKSIIIEHTERSGEIRIYGRYSHICEGLIRAAWASRSQHLNIYFESG